MSSFLYWPYDEVTLDAPSDQNVVRVKAPWLEATVGIKDENRENLMLLVDKFASQSLDSEDLPLINWFFGELEKYPLCYIVPTVKISESLDDHGLRDDKLVSIPYSDFLVATCEMQESELKAHEARELMSKLDRRDWSWDAEAALSFAQANGKIHPESLFSVIRRFHLLDVLERDEGHNKFEYIQSLEGEEFAKAAAILVRQNHYVTQRCQDSLLPALDTAGHARGQVEEFVKEENGHDRILGVAMKALSKAPEDVPVSVETKGIMHLLKFAAGRNFLAFAMAVDFFERSSYQEIDPLAQLLIKGGFEKAAKQINRHMEINDAGGHENVACGFLATMAPCDPAYALEAMRIAETISQLMNRITSSAVDLYTSSIGQD